MSIWTNRENSSLLYGVYHYIFERLVNVMKVKKTKRGARFDCYGRIKEFLNSGLPCDRVYYPHASAQSCVQSLCQTIKRERLYNVWAIRRGNYVILLKLDM